MVYTSIEKINFIILMLDKITLIIPTHNRHPYLTRVLDYYKNQHLKAIEELYNNSDLRNRLSKNAKEYAIQEFSINKMAKEWEEIFNEVLEFPKSIRMWNIKKEKSRITPKDIFLEALGSHGKNFVLYCNAETEEEKKIAIEKIKKMGEKANWQAKTRSTVHQYKNFFPNDPFLSIWSQLMREKRS